MIAKFKSNIESVTVYRSGAFITRAAAVHLQPGRHQVEIRSLPGTISQESIQVVLPEHLFCNQVSFRTNKKTMLKKELTPEQEEKILQLKKEKELVNARLQVTSAQYEALTKHILPPSSDNPPVEYIKEYLQFSSENLQKLSEESLKLKEEIKKIDKEIEAVTAETAEENDSEASLPGVITLDVSAPAEMVGTIQLMYYEHGATWTPFYDIRVKELGAPVFLHLKGKIQQNTGEDWENVRLTVSTGNLSQSNNQPELLPWYLNARIPAPIPAPYPKAYSAAQQTTALDETCILAPPAPTHNVITPPKNESIQNQTSVEYRLGELYNIPSDIQGNVVEIQQQQLNADYVYYTTPKAECSAFLMAFIKDWKQADMLDGSANIFLENRYVGATYINTNTAETSLKISLGRDRSILISREKLKNYSSRNLFGNTNVKECEYKLKVVNTKKENIRIQIVDQVPVSHDERISVDIKNITEAQLNPDTGKLTWEFELPANYEIKLNIAFLVKYPKDLPLSI